MSEADVRARAPSRRAPPEPVRDPSVIEAYLEDASASPPGTASGVLRVESEEEAAAFLAATAGRGVAVLPQAARSSLTGGAVPRGEVILSVERMSAIGGVEGRCSVTVEPGVRLRDLERSLAERGFYYPPVPTYQDAMVGGTVATNAGGAATFKYGVTRDWVEALRVVLGNGDVLAIERGEVVVPRGGTFRIGLSDGRTLEVPTPVHVLPPLRKTSAGYHSSDPLDLVDLLVGSEGTLGLVTQIRLRVVKLPAAVVTALAFVDSFDRAFALARSLREEALEARRDSRRADVRAIELIDGPSLALLRDHGDLRRLRVHVPERAGSALLLELELPEPVPADALLATVEAVQENRPTATGPLARCLRIVADHGALDELEIGLDERRRETLRELREAVPRRVNEILSAARRSEPGVRKMGGDLIVPFERVGDMMKIYQDGFSKRGLSYAIWGHLSDGNLHPNALPRSGREVDAAREAMLEFGAAAAGMGGCPLSEHGVGRSPLKQQLLRAFLGDEAIAAMRRVKQALDPEGRFAPGVLFSAPD